MSGLKRKLDQRHELASASSEVVPPQSEYYCQERGSEQHLLLTANVPASATPSSSRSRGSSNGVGGGRGGSRSRARGRGGRGAHGGRSTSVNGRGSSSINHDHDGRLHQRSHSDPHTPPRKKRPRRTKEEMMADNNNQLSSELQSPRATRQSARILSKFHGVPEEANESEIKQPDFNAAHEIHVGSDAAESGDKVSSPKSTATQPNIDSQSTSFKSTYTDASVPEGSSRRRRSSGSKTEEGTSFEEPAKSEGASSGRRRRASVAKTEAPTSAPASKQTSPLTRRKRNSSSNNNGDHPAGDPNSGSKKLKMENPDPSPSLESPAPHGSANEDGNENADPLTSTAGPRRLAPHLDDTPDIRSASQSVEVESASVAQEATPSEVSASPAPTQSETAELSSSTVPSVGPGRGRGRGGFRGRARGRGGWTRGRGRGGRGRGSGRGGRGSRLQPIERDMSLSPSPVVKQLRERQKELEKVFRRVAAAQRTALAVIATRSENKLIKDSKAHMSVPEYEQVMAELQDRLQQRLDIIEHEKKWKMKAADILFETNNDRVNTNFHDKTRHIRKEHLLAAQGGYMACVEQRRRAEDDDHTEADESGSETDTPKSRRFVRGFNSSFVRDPEGAALYARAASGWDDFIQRAKIENDISPQIKRMTEEARAPIANNDRISQLTEALTELCQQEDRHGGEKTVPVKPEEAPAALNALAEAAIGDFGRGPPQPLYGPPLHPPQLAPLRNLPGVTQDLQAHQQQHPPHPPLLSHQRPEQLARNLHRTILPQPVPGQIMPTDPRAFLPPPQPGLPPPSHHQQPGPPQPQQPPPSQRNLPSIPRRLLPASSSRYPSIPHLNELPDPFSSAPQQLPPPPGMTYHHPPPYPQHMAPHPSHGPPPPPQYMHAPVGPHPGMPVYHPGYYGPPPPPPPPGHQYPHQQHQSQYPPQHQHQHQGQQQGQQQQHAPPPQGY
ncbi:hypothetical protein FQN55_006045 [Onygenales sp. PD_40]|nr:hypothetical protein FQN55_006045 [Onygenales sp. PD_40]